jgi:hypothetical protein
MTAPRTPRPGNPRENPLARGGPIDVGPDLRDNRFRDQKLRHAKQLAPLLRTHVRTQIAAAAAGQTDDAAENAANSLDHYFRELNKAMKGVGPGSPEVKKQWDIVATKYRQIQKMKANNRYDPKVWKFLDPAVALFENSARSLP